MMQKNNEENLHNAHDKLFKATFQYVEAVVELVNFLFTREEAAVIDTEHLKLDTTHSISNGLQEFFSDVIYSTKQKGSKRNVLITLLLEHKSAPDIFVLVQLLNYMVSIWLKDIAAKRPLTVVIPVIFYHGKRKWKKKPFSDLFPGASPAFKKFMLEFDYQLLSVHQTPDEIIRALSADTLLGALMLTYKKIGDHDFAKNHAEEFFGFLKNSSHKIDLLRIFVKYFIHNANLTNEEIPKIIKKAIPSPIESDAMTAYQSIIKAGIKEGIKEGEVLGAMVKSQKTVERLLLRGILSIPEIADIVEVSVSFVLDIRDELLKDGKILSALVRNFKI